MFGAPASAITRMPATAVIAAAKLAHTVRRRCTPPLDVFALRVDLADDVVDAFGTESPFDSLYRMTALRM
jgi:hypothetical protein